MDNLNIKPIQIPIGGKSKPIMNKPKIELRKILV